MQAFDNYVKSYNPENAKIKLKINHIKRVANIAKDLAIKLNLSQEDIKLAELIGLLHDIGRFEQLRRFNTFFDHLSIDHAQFGADLLFKEGLMEKFDDSHENDELIEKAVRYHSLYRIPEGLTDREIMFCQIVRDADKVDIYRANYETGVHIVYQVTEEELRNSEITSAVYEVFCEERAIPRNIRKTVADNLVGHVALSFELVYPKSRELAAEQGYLWKLLDINFENPETVKTIGEICDRIRKWYQKNL